MPKNGVKLTNSKDLKLLKEIGRRVEKLRLQMELSPYDLTGDDMPVKSRQHWRRVEKGEKNINLTTLFKICRTLGTTPDKLLIGLK